MVSEPPVRDGVGADALGDLHCSGEAISKAAKRSLQKRNEMSVVVACVAIF